MRSCKGGSICGGFTLLNANVCVVLFYVIFSTHDHLNKGSTSFWALRLNVWLDSAEINRLAGGPLVHIDDVLTCWLEVSCGVISCGDEDLYREKVYRNICHLLVIKSPFRSFHIFIMKIQYNYYTNTYCSWGILWNPEPKGDWRLWPSFLLREKIKWKMKGHRLPSQRGNQRCLSLWSKFPEILKNFLENILSYSFVPCKISWKQEISCKFPEIRKFPENWHLCHNEFHNFQNTEQLNPLNILYTSIHNTLLCVIREGLLPKDVVLLLAAY